MNKSDELERLIDAQTPEAIFGKLIGSKAEQLEAARKIFRQLSKSTHPDAYQGSLEYDRAEAAFKKLNLFWLQARDSLAAGTYGTPASAHKTSFAPFVIRTGACTYHVQQILARGDLCTVYACMIERGGRQTRGILKVTRQPADNDLVANEARILTRLRNGEGFAQFRHFVPELVESFTSQDEKTGVLTQINALSMTEELVSLAELKTAFPHGLDPKDMAWIWRRLLVASGFTHMNNVIHGAVLPAHVLIQPDEHGLLLIDWSYAVYDPEGTGERISAISKPYRGWYPARIFAHQPPTFGLDIALAARCMIEVLGGDPIKLTLPAGVPWQIQTHLQGCVQLSASADAQIAAQVLKAFDDLLEQLWGPRTFHVLTLPKR